MANDDKLVKLEDLPVAYGAKLDKANVYNGLDKTASGFALDARQGKALNDALSGKQNTLIFDFVPTVGSPNPVESHGIYYALSGKFDANMIYNGVDQTASGYALDARQGKALDDKKLDTANVYNGLDKTAAGYALDARQGKALNDKINATQSDIAIIIDGNQTTHTGGVAINGFVYVRNSTISGITDGVYTAAQAIPANTAIDSTYLTAVDGGGLNELNGKIESLIKTASNTYTLTATANNYGYFSVPFSDVPNDADLISCQATCSSINALSSVSVQVIYYTNSIAYVTWQTKGTAVSNETFTVTLKYV